LRRAHEINPRTDGLRATSPAEAPPSEAEAAALRDAAFAFEVLSDLDCLAVYVALRRRGDHDLRSLGRLEAIGETRTSEALGRLAAARLVGSRIGRGPRGERLVYRALDRQAGRLAGVLANGRVEGKP
jgi:hypothetical protein